MKRTFSFAPLCVTFFAATLFACAKSPNSAASAQTTAASPYRFEFQGAQVKSSTPATTVQPVGETVSTVDIVLLNNGKPLKLFAVTTSRGGACTPGDAVPTLAEKELAFGRDYDAIRAGHLKQFPDDKILNFELRFESCSRTSSTALLLAVVENDRGTEVVTGSVSDANTVTYKPRILLAK